MKTDLFLPKTQVALKVNQETEAKMLQFWQENNTFEKVQLTKNNGDFVLLDGPPYANGEAHLGHVLNKVVKDLLLKSNWLMGKKTHYQPGWDCYGLPLELLVEKKLGKSKKDLNFKALCKRNALKGVVKQRKMFKKLGVLGAWDNPYLTMSHNYNLEAFNTLSSLVEQDLLEYKKYPVHYCPQCQSALAEAELEYVEKAKSSLYFKMPLTQLNGKTVYALVWTTTPWTLPMNEALAFNSDFTYCLYENNEDYLVALSLPEKKDYQKVGEFDLKNYHKASHPVFLNKVVPLLQASFVDNKGTGFVHVAPMHGPEDFDLGVKNNLPMNTYLNEYGKFTSLNLEALNLDNKSFTQVGNLVVDYLKTNHYLFSYSEENTELAHCWRHKFPTYYLATNQVFLNLEAKHNNLKAKLVSLLSESTLKEVDKQNLMKMVKDRSVWCLSRQRTWGTPLPLWVKDGQFASENQNYLSYLAKDMKDSANELAKTLTQNGYTQLNDVLDVWFDSGNAANYFLSQKDLPVDMVVEGKDQYRGWFQSLLWLTLATHDSFAFKDLLTHGFVLDKEKEKFAKSKGNAPDLKVFLKDYGADTLRLWVAHSNFNQDVVFAKEKLDALKTVYQRMRLTLRFCDSNLFDYDNQTVELKNDFNVYLLNTLYECQEKTMKLYKEYNFKEVVNTLYDFCDNTLSSLYFKWAKNTLYLSRKENRKEVQYVLSEVKKVLLTLFSPLTPFLVEEVFQSKNEKSVFEHQYVLAKPKAYQYNWQEVLSVKEEVLSFLESQKESFKDPLELKLLMPNVQKVKEVENENFLFKHLFGVSDVEFYNGNTFSLKNLKSTEGYQKCERCWEYHTKLFSSLCESCKE
jgi:isoleucyl-tRNA synthetase